jgi:NAD(P)-dependent dehydrogenase (short-subunit alcohol dehydrogenase family)
MVRLRGRVAIVTGASRGIGKGIAKAFADEGARVVVVARTEEVGRLPGTIHQTVAEIREAGGDAVAVRCDVSDDDQVRAMVKATIDTCGHIDVLVNNAAITLRPLVKDTEPRHFQLILRVNLLGPLLTCKYVVPVMEAQRGGSIINLTSAAAGSRGGGMGGASYAITKSGLNQLSMSLAEEVRSSGIAVNSLDPGGVITEGALATRPKDYDWSGRVPVSAIGPSAIALALKDAATMTGQVVRREDYGLTWQ